MSLLFTVILYVVLTATLFSIAKCFNIARSKINMPGQMEIITESDPHYTAVRDVPAMSSAKCWYLGGACSVDKDCCRSFSCDGNVCQNEDSGGPIKENFKTSTWLKQMGLQKNRPINPKQDLGTSTNHPVSASQMRTSHKAEKPRYKVHQGGEYDEGDIMVPPQGRAGRIDSNYRWKDGLLIYEIDASFKRWEKDTILEAMETIRVSTKNDFSDCIRFRLRTTEDDYVYIQFGGNRCASFVGRKGGKQVLKLAEECIHKGTIMHELMHALGFKHEHTRPDRDSYITVDWNQIERGREKNFNVSSAAEYETYGVPYDYGSIMHYGADDFAIGDSPILIPNPTHYKGEVLGQMKYLTDRDILKLRKMHGCHKEKD